MRPWWRVEFDVNEDGKVDVKDLAEFLRTSGSSAHNKN